VSPAVFVPIAEEMGLMARLGLHVLQTACGEAAHWQIDHLAVNVSVVQLRESTFLAKVMDVLATTGMPAGRLEFEITESIWIDGNAQCLANLEALRAAGIRIALDDFGTGFSTFERLRDTSVDRIKIDQSFIRGFGKALGDEAIVGAIIELARARGLKTTAEGIETTEQLQALQAMGCDDLQGFLLGRPMSAGAFKHLLGEAARSRRAIDRRSSAAG
jgi:EAL domain-containing protein (putative c-di-GMP-specific phosphodiesterase class I)